MGKLFVLATCVLGLTASPVLAGRVQYIAPAGGDSYRPGSPRPVNPAAVDPPPPPRAVPQPPMRNVPPESFNPLGSEGSVGRIAPEND